MTVPDKLRELVDRFQYQIDEYKSGKYNETQVRIDFINPLFDLLGWDVNNKANHAEAYRDVIHEDSIKIGGATKAPDYCFRVGGTRKFFLEAKKPSVRIKENEAASFQLRRYGWSARLPISILTDFEEFAVYDTRIKPSQSDKSSKARIDYSSEYFNKSRTVQIRLASPYLDFGAPLFYKFFIFWFSQILFV